MTSLIYCSTIIVLSQNSAGKQYVSFLICASHMHSKYTTNTAHNRIHSLICSSKLDKTTNYVIDLQIRLVHFPGMTMAVCWPASLQLWPRLNYFNNCWTEQIPFPSVRAVFCAYKLMFALSSHIQIKLWDSYHTYCEIRINTENNILV